MAEITNGEIFRLLKDLGYEIKSNDTLKKEILDYLTEAWNLNDDQLSIVRIKVDKFAPKLATKWNKANRTEDAFLKKECNWLSLPFTMPANTDVAGTSEVAGTSSENTGSSKRPGRPSKSFTESSSRSKQRKIAEKASECTTPESLALTKYKLHAKGYRTETNVIDEVVKDHASAQKVKKELFKPRNPIPFTKDEALAFLMQNNLTKKQYMNIRLGSKNRNADIYPKYATILEAKNDCYPSDIFVSEKGCAVPLQSILDHTTKRIFKLLAEIREEIAVGSYEMTYKWGIDGTSDQVRYRQRFKDFNPEDIDETSLLVISLVPLKLSICVEGEEPVPVWENLGYSSPLFCRPISFEFSKETEEITREKTAEIENQTLNLIPTTIPIGENVVSVSHRLILSMIDGKATTALTEVSSQTCQICGAKPSEMNQLQRAEIQGNPDSVGYVMSVLHTNIRMFECLLHVAYRIEIQKWRVTSAEDKQIMLETKTRIQNRFREETGLLVDVVLQGKGTTNDGNTARRFFKDPVKSAEITGIDVNLIRRFSFLLKAINLAQPINVNNFRAYALETARLFTTLYPWYYLPAHTHKLLLHGANIIQHSLLPLGMLSEEASEASNKLYRKFRQGFTLKTCRTRVNSDLMNRLLISSDPYISTIRTKQTRKNMKQLEEEVLTLLDITNVDDRSRDDEEVEESIEELGEKIEDSSEESSKESSEESDDEEDD